MCHDGVQCKRTICFFAHTPEELRDATYVGDTAGGRGGSDSNPKGHHSAPSNMQHQQHMQGRGGGSSKGAGAGAAGGRGSNGSNPGQAYPPHPNSSSSSSSSDTRVGDAGGLRPTPQQQHGGQHLPPLKLRDSAPRSGNTSPWSVSEGGLGTATPVAGAPSVARVSWPGNLGLGGDAEAQAAMAAQLMGQGGGGYDLSPAHPADLGLESYMALGGGHPGVAGFGGMLPPGLHHSMGRPSPAGLPMDSNSHFWVGAAEVAAAAVAAGGPMCHSTAIMTNLSGGTGVSAGDVQLVPARRMPNGTMVVLDGWNGTPAPAPQALHMLGGGGGNVMWLQGAAGPYPGASLSDSSLLVCTPGSTGSPGGDQGMCCDMTPTVASAAMGSVFHSSSSLVMEQEPGTPLLSPGSNMSTTCGMGVVPMSCSSHGSSMAPASSGAPAATGGSSNSRLSRMTLPRPAFHPCYYDTPLSAPAAAMATVLAAATSVPLACSDPGMGVGSLLAGQGREEAGLSGVQASEAPPGLSGIQLNMAGLALAVGGGQAL
jgi:hypothetical protein